MAPRRELVETIYEQLKARERPDDADMPVRDGPIYYQARFEEGGQYRIWSRWPARDLGAEQGPTGTARLIRESRLSLPLLGFPARCSSKPSSR